MLNLFNLGCSASWLLVWFESDSWEIVGGGPDCLLLSWQMDIWWRYHFNSELLLFTELTAIVSLAFTVFEARKEFLPPLTIEAEGKGRNCCSQVSTCLWTPSICKWSALFHMHPSTWTSPGSAEPLMCILALCQAVGGDLAGTNVSTGTTENWHLSTPSEGPFLLVNKFWWPTFLGVRAIASKLSLFVLPSPCLVHHFLDDCSLSLGSEMQETLLSSHRVSRRCLKTFKKQLVSNGLLS